MSYPPNGYGHGQYAGYQGYGQQPTQMPQQMYQANQAHRYQQQQQQQQQQMQHPTVVIPTQQPRYDVSNVNLTSPHLYQQPHPQSGFYQQSPSQYQPPPQYHSQPQQYYPQNLQYQQQQQQAAYQANFQQPQPAYQQQARQPSSQPSPQLQYQQSPPSFSQPSPSTHLRSSPDPLQGPTTYVQRHQPSQRQPQSSTQASRQQQQNRHSTYATAPTHQQPQHRVATHVEIPSNKSSQNLPDHDMARAPKRRRSNDGQAMSACEVPMPSKQSSQQLKQAPRVASSPLTELNSSQLPPTPQPSVDYQAVLLALSDEYTNSAYGLSTSIAAGIASEEQTEEYYSLISTAMACLESVLNNYRQSDPRREARIRLRLASLLVEETENDEQAELMLSKGIALCDRNRLPDVKYAMQHLSTRLTFKRSPKAAIKAAEKLIQEVETLRLGHWIYAFRLLRVSLGLQRGGHAEHAAILKHLAALNTMSEEQRDVSVRILAATFEAIAHIHSASTDALDLTQRAMATARTHQLRPEMQKMPQIRGLLDCLDLACALIQFNPDQAGLKLQQMQSNLDTGTRDAGWSKDGSFVVALGQCANENLEQDTGGIMRCDSEGRALLTMRWITNGQLYALGFLLSALATMYKNPGDGKAEQFLDEGLKMTLLAPNTVAQSLNASTMQLEQQQALGLSMRLHKIFAAAGRFEWETAREGIKTIRQDFANAGSEIDDDVTRVLMYLEGLCRQGLGELQAALDLYNSPMLIFEGDSKASTFEKDLRILATLNSIFILRTLGPEGITKAETLATAVEQYCLNHPNKSINAVYHLARASTPGTNNTMIKTKQYIQSAVQASKAASNNQLLCIVMNTMTDMFFRNTIVGEQAEKSAQAGRTLAKKGRSRLWTCVADGMYGDIMERCGKAVEADAARREAMGMYEGLPESLRRNLGEGVY